MIELDKNFVEERKREQQRKLDQFKQESIRDYKEYISKKDSVKLFQRNHSEDKTMVSLKLKPDERFFKYQENYFKKTILDSPKVNTETSQRSNYNGFSTSNILRNIKPVYRNNQSQNFEENKGLIKYPYAISLTTKGEESNAEKSKSVNNKNVLSHSLKETSLQQYKSGLEFLNNNKGKIENKGSFYSLLEQKKVKYENETKKMINPYSLKNSYIGMTRIKDNPLVFEEGPYYRMGNQAEKGHSRHNSHSNFKQIGSQILQLA